VKIATLCALAILAGCAEKTCLVRGRVADLDGKPAAGAVVGLDPDCHAPSAALPAVRTNEDGTFEFRFLGPLSWEEICAEVAQAGFETASVKLETRAISDCERQVPCWVVEVQLAPAPR